MYVCGRKKGFNIHHILPKCKRKRDFDIKFKELMDNGVIITKYINSPIVEVLR